MIDELKRRMIAKSAKIKRYEQIIDQFRQNKIFSVGRKKIYKELSGGEVRTNYVPDVEECRRFWSDIWSVKKNITKVQNGYLN